MPGSIFCSYNGTFQAGSSTEGTANPYLNFEPCIGQGSGGQRLEALEGHLRVFGRFLRASENWGASTSSILQSAHPHGEGCQERSNCTYSQLLVILHTRIKAPVYGTSAWRIRQSLS